MQSWITSFGRVLHFYSNWKYLLVPYCTPYQRTSYCLFHSFLTAKTSGCIKEMVITLDFLKYWQSGQQDLLMDCSDGHNKYLSWSLAVSTSERGSASMLLRPRGVTRDVSMVGVRHMLWGLWLAGASLILVKLRLIHEAVTEFQRVLLLKQSLTLGYPPNSRADTQR